MLPLLWTSVAHADDVLVPEFTPETISDFGNAFVVYQSLTDDLESRNVSFVDADRIRNISGDRGDACAETDDCPAVLFGDWDAHYAVVGFVGGADTGELRIVVEIHDAVNSTPVWRVDEQVPDAGLYDFTGRVADQLVELLELVAPVDDGALVIGGLLDEPVDGPDETASLDDLLDEAFNTSAPEPELPTFEPEPLPEPDSQPGVETERPTMISGSKAEREQLGVGERGYRAYLNSDLPKEMWLDKAKVRSGMFTVTLAGGYGLGDVSRSYDVRVAATYPDYEVTETYQADGLISDGDLTGSVSLGYHAASWVELGVSAGLQQGKHYANTGYEYYMVDGESGPAAGGALDPAVAWAAILQAYGRFYAVGYGTVKPYALLLAGAQIHDGLEVPPDGELTYPSRPGATLISGGAGGGLMIDANDHVGFFVEVPISFLFGDDITLEGTQTELIQDVPTPMGDSVGYVLRPSLGVQTRF